MEDENVKQYALIKKLKIRQLVHVSLNISDTGGIINF